jgi:hypothetical protein
MTLAWQDCAECGRTADQIAECGHAESCSFGEATQPGGAHGQLRLIAVRLRALAERLDGAEDQRAAEELRQLARLVDSQVDRIAGTIPPRAQSK